MEIRAWGRSDRGKVRDANQDRFLCDRSQGIFAVADGIGGKPGGELASQAIVDGLKDWAPRIRAAVDAVAAADDEQAQAAIIDTVMACLQEINGEVYRIRERQEYSQGVGSTADVVVLGRGGAFVFHVGDSRVYLLRQDKVFRLTRDHTFEERLRADKELQRHYHDASRYAHVLTRSVGGEPHVRVDRFFVDLRAGDRLVLCTDGLSNYVSGAEIGEFASNYDAEDLPLGLIACANERGGGDNCTVVTVSVPDGGQPQFEGAPTRPDKLRSVRFLESIDLFSELDFQELFTAAQFITGQVAGVDDKVIAREDAVDGMYVVMSGVLAVEIDGMELNRVEAGDHFGEFALFGSPLRSADVRCLENAKLLHISSENLERLVVAYPEIGNKILRALLSRTSKIIQDMLAAEEEGAS